MAPFKLASLTGRRSKKHAPSVVSGSEPVPQVDVEAGSFLNESQRNNRTTLPAGEKGDGGGAQLDEYRALVPPFELIPSFYLDVRDRDTNNALFLDPA